MENFKEPISWLLKKWYVMSLAIIIIAYALGNHAYRCYHHLNSSLLWGLSECQDCKDEYVKTIRDTVYRDTCRSNFKQSTTGPKAPEVKKTSYDLSHANINGPSQFGDNNTQNNQFGLKPREVTETLLNEIMQLAPNKNTPIGVAQRSRDPESFEFATKIVKALNARGYKNAFVNGIVDDRIIGGDPEEAAKQQRKIGYKWNEGQLDIALPGNQ